MLLNKTPSPTEVLSFKLISGEEIISRVYEEQDDHYLLNKPLCLIPGPNGGLGLAPAMFSTEPKEFVRLNKSAVALLAKTLDEISSQYLTQTTGLKLAKSL
jgi:hypothetical protein